ncbi:TonB-dependent receptor [soil metagenome]
MVIILPERKKILRLYLPNKIKVLLLIQFAFLYSNLPLFAQESLVTGTVTDQADGSGIPGASIIFKGTTIGTASDIDGSFNLNVPDLTGTLVVSFTGYRTIEVPINGRNNLQISLQEDIRQLQEVVVIGYGTVEKRDLTGAVSSVKNEEIIKIPASNPVQALQGKVAGLQVTSPSGAPGANPVVRVRGVGTFNNASPIYVVDGVILNDISFLNAADIESMEVLKDASATAIYGSRGANGVILVTTRRADTNVERPVFNYSGEFSMQYLAKKIDLLNGREFAIISNEIQPGSFNNVDILPDTDWQDLIFSPAPIHNHTLSVMGSSPRSNYYMSVGYFGQEGIIDKSDFKRMTVKLNNSYTLSEAVTLGNNLTFAPYRQQNSPDVVFAAYRAQPIAEPYLQDGNFGAVRNVGNPLASLFYSNNYNTGIRGVGNFFIDVEFLKNFTFRSSYGIDLLYNRSESFTPAFTIFFEDGQPSAQQNLFSSLNKGTTLNPNWLWENTISFYKDFERHRINAVAGYTMQESSSEIFNLSGQNLIRDGRDFWYIRPEYVYDPANNINNIQSIGNVVDPNQFFSMISYLFRANYTFENRYILTATFRRDGSSKFTEANRFANFPSLAVGWNIINEPFMDNLSLFTNLKLRGSWGRVGNEKINYLRQYSTVQSGLLVILGENQAAIPAASFGAVGNPDLKWETTEQIDIGLEIGLLKNKLSAELDYYRKVTNDILVDLTIPGFLGNGPGVRKTVNAGSILNSGIELSLNWNDQINENLSYRVGFIGSTLHNKVLTIGGSAGVDSTLVGGFLGDGRPATLSREGLPIGAFYGYKTDGIFQNKQELDAYPHLSQAGIGDLRFVDVNNDGVLDANDRTYLGSPIPDYIFGINLSVQFKNLDFSLDFQGQIGNKILNGKELVRPDPYNFEQRVFNRWRGEGTSNTEPRPSFGGYNYNISDHFIQDGSFGRLRNVILGYSLPQAISSRLKMQQVRFYIGGTNLLTFTRFTGYTPEIASEDVLSNGIDRGAYPVSAIYSAGLNINF